MATHAAKDTNGNATKVKAASLDFMKNKRRYAASGTKQ
jgi:hypothetical protein